MARGQQKHAHTHLARAQAEARLSLRKKSDLLAAPLLARCSERPRREDCAAAALAKLLWRLAGDTRRGASATRTAELAAKANAPQAGLTRGPRPVLRPAARRAPAMVYVVNGAPPRTAVAFACLKLNRFACSSQAKSCSGAAGFG
jgi:hypothetical protein